jgi:hypothetical protein
MDCELCEKSLVDFLYGELDDDTSAQIRSHLEGCDACRLAYSKLEVGRAFARKLVIEPAPSTSKALAAARERARAHRASREQVAARPQKDPSAPRHDAPVPEEDSSISSWLRWLGAMVMGPQLGVVTVLLLVVGIGLWYLPQLGAGGGRGAAPLLEPDPQQTSETGALEPAEPLQLSHDPRTGRVRVDDERQGEVVLAEESDQPTEREIVRPDVPRDPSERRTETAPEAPSTATDRLAAVEAEVAPREDPGRVQMDSLPELTTGAGAYEGGALPATPTPAAEALTMPTPPTGLGVSATRPPVTEQPDFDSVPGGPEGNDLAAAALHGQARQLAAAGRCADSVARYQQLQSRYPSYPESGRASLEMADCLRRLARPREARAALERAARSPVATVAAAARRQVLEMDMQDRAAEAAPTPAEASQ